MRASAATVQASGSLSDAAPSACMCVCVCVVRHASQLGVHPSPPWHATCAGARQAPRSAPTSSRCAYVSSACRAAAHTQAHQLTCRWVPARNNSARSREQSPCHAQTTHLEEACVATVPHGIVPQLTLGLQVRQLSLRLRVARCCRHRRARSSQANLVVQQQQLVPRSSGVVRACAGPRAACAASRPRVSHATWHGTEPKARARTLDSRRAVASSSGVITL
jgi:hypothetical protein